MWAIVNKPKGMSSFHVIRILRRRLGIKKMGHAGTLDPLAQGLLLIATDKSTKEISLVQHLPKTYQATWRIDGFSSSGDEEGEVSPVEMGFDSQRGSEILVQTIHNHFIGDILQSPHQFSAVWIDGQRAYELARKSIEFEIPKKMRTIYSAELIRYDYPVCEGQFCVSSGTYIRSLVEDIGKQAGCGGYLTDLVRTQIGSIGLVDAKGVDDIEITDLYESLPISEK